MATGVGWDFVRINCLSPVQQTCTWTLLPCKTLSSQRSKKNTTQGTVQTKNRQIFTILLQKFTTGSQKQFFPFTALLMHLLSRPDPYKTLQSPNYGLMKRMLDRGSETGRSPGFFSHHQVTLKCSMSVAALHFLICETLTPTLLVSQDHGEG